MSTSETRTVALVTGGQGGIGTAICAALHRAELAVVSVDHGLGEQNSQPPRPWTDLSADVTDPESLRTMWATIDAEYGTPSVLINNAGIYQALAFDTTTAEQFQAILAVNTVAPFVLAQSFASRLIAAGRPGSIVNVASVSGRVGSPDVAYGASKGALIALTKGLGTVLAPHGIRVNAVAPGLVATPMLERIPADRRGDYAQATPLGRFAEPEEIARVVSALVTGADSYMTRAVIDVNGGLY